MNWTGPFRWSRHPLNFWMVPLLWLTPRMTIKLATFNALMTAYLIIGSLHEEARLGEVYGEAYDQYQASGVNFFVPFTSGSRRGTLTPWTQAPGDQLES
jgi:protein-S-isoprenylcysteine O-methyltransferase Ste14